MPFIDQHAKAKVRELREERGLSQEGLAIAIRRHARREGWLSEDGIGAVDPFTIRRIESFGHCPSERIRLVIALFFGVRPNDIWQPSNRLKVTREQRDALEAVAA